MIPSLQLGLEFNLAVEEVGPLVTWFLTTETHTRPAVFLGTSSDRIGSPEGKQAYFLTVAKRAAWVPVSAYVALNYSEWDERFNVPFGLTGWIGQNFSVQPMFDGDRSHLMVSYARGGLGISFLWVWLEEPGVSISAGF